MGENSLTMKRVGAVESDRKAQDKSRDSDQFLVNTQVQSHALLC